MIGLKIGLTESPTVGPVIGPNTGSTASIPGVSRDASSQIYCPANATEWTAFMAGAGLATGNPSNLQLCQEASGNLADSIDAMTLVVASTPTFRQAFAGWTRTATAITSTTLQSFSAAAGVGPNPATQSVAWGGWIGSTVTPGGNRNLIVGTDTASGIMLTHNAANKLLLTCLGVSATSVNNYTLATAYPVVLVYNRTALSVTLYTHLEILTGTFAVVVDGNKGFGALAGNSDPSSKYLYMFEFAGAPAELTTANVRTLLQTAGWTIPW